MKWNFTAEINFLVSFSLKEPTWGSWKCFSVNKVIIGVGSLNFCKIYIKKIRLIFNHNQQMHNHIIKVYNTIISLCNLYWYILMSPSDSSQPMPCPVTYVLQIAAVDNTVYKIKMSHLNLTYIICRSVEYTNRLFWYIRGLFKKYPDWTQYMM